jgi:hypothetical protein
MAGKEVLKPVVARYRQAVADVAFRGDAAFAGPSTSNRRASLTQSAFTPIRYSRRRSHYAQAAQPLQQVQRL